MERNEVGSTLQGNPKRYWSDSEGAPHKAISFVWAGVKARVGHPSVNGSCGVSAEVSAASTEAGGIGSVPSVPAFP